MNDLEIGKAPVPNVNSRDAMHMPVMVAIAYDNLAPGTRVRYVMDRTGDHGPMNNDYEYPAVAVACADGAAFVDPWGPGAKEGDKVLLLFKPGTFGKLTHSFEHDADQAQHTDPDSDGCAFC